MNYRDMVLRNCPNFENENLKEKLGLGGLGIAGEAGEVAYLIKKHIYHDKTLDRDKLIKEMGDVRWYLEYLAIVLNTTMGEVELVNMTKLLKRYPNGFTYEAANAPRGEE